MKEWGGYMHPILFFHGIIKVNKINKKMEETREVKVVVSLIHGVIVDVNGKNQVWDRLIFNDVRKFFEGSRTLEIILKNGKHWFFPYTNIKSVEYKENVKETSKY